MKNKRGSFFPKLILIAFSFAALLFVVNYTGHDVLTFSSGGESVVIGGSSPSVFFPSPSGTVNVTNGTTTPTTTAPSGGSTGTAVGSQLPNAVLNISNISLYMQVNTNKQESILVKNTGSSTQNFQVSQTGLDNMVIIGDSNLTIAPGGNKTLNLIFVAPSNASVYTGKLIVGGTEVPVSLNVQSNLTLFDSFITVTNINSLVAQGENLNTRIKLTPKGDISRMDVTLNYTIKDYSGKVYSTSSETLLVNEPVTLTRSFDTSNLPLGKYVIELDLIYPNGVAPSSAHFEVVEKSRAIFGEIIYYSIIGLLMVSIMIVTVLLSRSIKKRKNGEEESENEQET